MCLIDLTSPLVSAPLCSAYQIYRLRSTGICPTVEGNREGGGGHQIKHQFRVKYMHVNIYPTENGVNYMAVNFSKIRVNFVTRRFCSRC